MAEENKHRENEQTRKASWRAARHTRAKPLRICETRLARWRENTVARLNKPGARARGKAEQAWDDATSRARTFQEDAEQYVRENPTKAVFTALGIGFVLGLIFRR